MKAVEDIINIPMLLKYFEVIKEKNKINSVIDEIALQSQVEFNYEE